jgi:HK97 family phage portal protein
MKLLTRLREFFGKEERAADPSWAALQYGAVDLSGGIVNPKIAENLSAILACVNAISSSMASLPALVFRRLDKGREEDPQHPVAKLIANGPNQHQTWADFVEWLVASTLLRGNGLAEILHDARGAVIGLKPIPWEWCSVQLLGNGRLAYDIVETTALYGGTGKPRRLLQDEVLHLRDRSDDGLIGRSRLARASSVLQSGMSIQEFGNSLYRNGVNPSGALSVDHKLTLEQKAQLAQHFREQFAGPSKTAKALVLEQGMKWQTISISPEDAEFLSSRRFTVEELCRLYGVPPPVAGDLTHGTFSNVESLLRWFAQATLTPWCRKLEAEFTRSVFSSASRTTHTLELDLSGLLRGAPSERWAAWKIAREADILDANEIREIEGFNPRAKPEPSIA